MDLKRFAPTFCAFLATAVSQARAAAVAAGTYPTFGLQFTPPPETSAAPPAGPGRVANYQLSGGSLVLIEIESARGKTAEAVATAIATKAGVAVKALDTPVGGEKAVGFEMPMTSAPFTHRQAVIVVHNDWTYVFSAVRTAAEDPAPALTSLLKSVHFTGPKPPAGELAAMSETPVEVFGKFTITLGRIVRPVTAEEKLLHLGIYDYTQPGHMKNPLNVDFERIRLAAPKTFAEIKDAYGASLQKQLNTPAAFVWQTVPTVPGLNVSQLQAVTVSLPDGKSAKLTNRYCVMELAAGDFVQMTFTISDVPAAEVAAYNDLVERSLKTVKVGAAGKAP